MRGCVINAAPQLVRRRIRISNNPSRRKFIGTAGAVRWVPASLDYSRLLCPRNHGTTIRLLTIRKPGTLLICTFTSTRKILNTSKTS